MLWIAVLILNAGMAFSQIPENIQHKVQVSAWIIPVFAVDANGNPVFDLREEDMQITIDGRPVSLQYLMRRNFLVESQERIETDAPENPPAATAAGPQLPRLIFLLIDETFSNISVKKRIKEVCQKLIDEGGEADRFVVMGINSWRGLYYIAGPEPKSSALKAKIEKLPLNTQGTRMSLAGRDVTDGGTDLSLMPFMGILAKDDEPPSEWFRSVKAMKYALRTFPQAKVVFLISQGIPSGLLWQDGFPRGFGLLKDLAKAFNESGTAIFAVNPSSNQATWNRGQESLVTLTEAAGGKYFSGKKVDDLVSTIRRTTSGYYELVLGGDTQIADASRLQITSRRPGIQIIAPQALSRHKSYGEMNGFERELFAVDICLGGLWSRMAGSIQGFAIDHREPGEGIETVEGVLPPAMRQQPLDLFCIRLADGSMDPVINKKNEAVGDRARFQVKRVSGERVYLLAISPGSGRAAICRQLAGK